MNSGFVKCDIIYFMASYKDLVVWQKSYSLVLEIYSVTKKFPKEEQFCLVNQMRRAAVSLPSNLAEGNTRRGMKEHIQFFRIAAGSLSELETQVMLSKDLKYLSESDFHKIQESVQEIHKMLSRLIASISKI